MIIKENIDGVISERELTEEELEMLEQAQAELENRQPTEAERIDALEEAMLTMMMGGEELV